MKLLLDTHALIWAFADDLRLSAKARELIEDGSNVVFASAVSAWEIAIKRSLGKLKAPQSYASELSALAIDELPIASTHVLAVEHLPPHHYDPFDRLLIAQAQVDGLTIVSKDRRFSAYDVPTRW